MTVKLKYYWKELSSDGLLKDPPESGPHYDRITPNSHEYNNGYESQDEAILSLGRFLRKVEFYSCCDLVLVPIYSY